MLLLTLGAHAQLTVTPSYDVKWKSHKNSRGDVWLALEDTGHWGAATSKNRLLTAEGDGRVQYRLDHFGKSMAFGFNYTPNDDDTTNQIALYFKNIDFGFIYHEHTLYSVIDGKMGYLLGDVYEEKLLTLEYQSNKNDILFYIDDSHVESKAVHEDTFHITAMLRPGSVLNTLVCNFSYPLEAQAGKNHVTTADPASGLLVVNAEGGLPPYRFLCAETGSTEAFQAGLEPGTYHVTVKDSLNDSLVVRADIGFTNTWRILREVALTDSGYVKTGTDTSKAGVLVGYNMMTEGSDGFCEVTVTESSHQLAFGFMGFKSGHLLSGYDMPLVKEEEINVLLPYADSLLVHDKIDTLAPKIQSEYKRLHLVYFKDGMVQIGFQDFTIPDSNPITYQPGDRFRMQRTEDVIHLYKNDVLVASTNIDDLEEQTLLSAILVKEGTAQVRGSASLDLREKIKAAQMPEYLCTEPVLNWVRTKTFDENGVVKSESKAYMDGLGRNIQNQAKQFSKNNALVSEPLFDSWGRAVGQSLAAPSFNHELCYVERFIQRTSTTAYAATDFDNAVGTGLSGDILDAFNALGDVNHPKAVYNGTQGKLGWYYSDNNTAEALVAADVLPYARVEYDDNGRLRRSAGVGSTLNMGSGHETHFIYTSTPALYMDPATNELNSVFPYGTYELENNFGVYTNEVNHNLQLFKTISINPDGRDQISYTNAAGQTIATCITGDGTGCVSHLEKKILFPVSTQEKLQNIYVPAAKSGTLRFREFAANNTAQATAAVPALRDLMTGATLVSGTDYSYNSTTGYFTFTGNYAGRSLYLQFTYSGTVTPNATLAVTAETDYTQWTLYFYDRKGRLLANTSPESFACQTLPTMLQRNSQQGSPGLSCNNSRVGSVAFNNDVKNAGEVYASIRISESAQALSALTGPGTLYLLQSKAAKYAQDSLYFLNDTIAKDSLFIDAQDTTRLPALMFPTDSALAMYQLIDSLETQVPVNALRGKAVRYSGEYAIYARFAHDSLGAEPLLTIPYDFTVSGDGSTDSSGGATLRVFGHFPKIREKIKLPIMAGEEGIDIKVKNPKINLYNFGSDEPNVAGCQDPHSWVPEAFHPLLDGIGQATIPDIDIDIIRFPTPLTIPLANKYMYDEYDRLVGSINEDQGTVYYVYDQKEDKLLFTQNQKQRDNGGKFSCIVYDQQARPVVSGEYDPANGGPTTGDTPYLFQDYYTWKAGTTVPSGRISTGAAAAANSDAYNDGHLFERTFIEYDKADVSLPTSFGSNPLYYKQSYTAAKVSKTWNDNTTTWYSYDELGRQAWTVQHSTALGYKTMRYIYDFRGKLQASGYQLLETDNLIHNYTYDADERLSTALYGVYTSTNPVNFMKPLGAYEYYLHGPLKRSVLGNNLQGLDYVYTIDGKLKAVNNPVNSATGSDPGLDGYSTGPHAAVSPDAFGYALEYYPGDYERSGSPIRSYTNADAYANNLSYSGLVKAQSWRTVLPTAATTSYSTGLMYEYQYDELYRLTGATFGTITETAPTVGNPQWSNTFTQKPEYKLENIDYDQNGNLQHLKRYAAPINSTTAHLLDNLTYNYDSTKKNKLKQVGDVASNTAGYSADLDLPNQSNSSNYVYNSIGELIENKQEGRGYEYNSAGLVTRVYELSTNNSLTEYTYNDKGLKYSKTSYSGGLFSVETEQLFYVYDAGGAEVATYKKLVQIPNDVYALQHHTLYGAGRVGLLDKSTGKALFELSDHLGNVRAVVTTSANGAAETISYTDYYPHGGVLPGRNYQSSLNFPYGYQGQEKDGATGLTNFELRQYDPRIGRWYNPDPYMQHHSPYLAMSNNPVSFTDPDGGWDWDGDKAYKNAMVANDERNKGDFLAQSFASGGNAYNWMAVSPADRAVMQKFYGTSYGEQDKNKILDLATLGDGYQMKDGGYFSLSNGKITRTDYTTNNFNYLTERVHNADGTVSETYSSGSYVSSTSKTYGRFNAGEVYGMTGNRNNSAKSNAKNDFSRADGHHGFGLNLGGGIGVMAQSVEVNAGAFVNSNGIGQMYISWGHFDLESNIPVYVNAGVSAQLLYIHTQAKKIDLSGDGNTGGLGYGSLAGSYGYSHNDKGERTDIYGAGIGAGIKYSAGYTKTHTYTYPIVLQLWLPKMMR